MTPPNIPQMRRDRRHQQTLAALVSDQEMDIARKAGIDDSLMLEIVAIVALNTLTNYANRFADTEIDSPVVGTKS